MGRAHRRSLSRIFGASLLLIAATLLPVPSAGAAPAVVVDGVENSTCHPGTECLVAIVGSALDEVTGVSTLPARTVSISSRTATRLVVRFAPKQADALVDLVLHTAEGDVTLPDAVVLSTNEGLYWPVDPTRIFDTRRADLGGPQPVPANGTVTVPSPDAVVGVAASKSFVVNVTVVTPAALGYLTVFPGDGPRPLASNLNFVAGRTVANLVSVVRAADGTFKITNTSARPAHVVVDLVGVHGGLFSSGAYGLVPLEPVRAYDSRQDGPFSSEFAEDVELGELPVGTKAVVLNVTAVGASRAGHVTVFPSTEPDVPLVSNLNVANASPIANLVVVAAESDGVISVATSIPRVDLVFDVVGVYAADTSFAPPAPRFRPIAPTRILDTRNGTGAPPGAIGQGRELVFDIDDVASVPDDAEAVLMNVTATGSTTAGYLSIWPGGMTRPVVSSLNFLAGQTVPNLVLVPIGADGTVRVFTLAASAHVVADLAGYYSYSGGTPWPS